MALTQQLYHNNSTQSILSSGVKYLSKNTLKFYLSCFLGYLYFTFDIFDNYYFTTFLKQIMYFFTSYIFPEPEKY